MKSKFFAIGIFVLCCALQIAPRADAKSDETQAPLFTRETLQRVSFQIFGGYAGTRSLVTIQLSPPKAPFTALIAFKSNAGGRAVKQSAQLEATEVDELLRVLNAANLPKLNGKKYDQPNLDDGFNETLTIVQRDGKKFVVQNYGDQAPVEYSAIARYVRELQQRKLSK